MPGVTFTKESLMGTQQLDATWYTLEQVDVVEDTAKDGSTNWVVDFKVIGPKFVGVRIRNWFNEKPGIALDRTADYIKCHTKNTDQLIGREVIDVLRALNGKQVSAYIKYDIERKSNSIMDFKPVGK